MSRCIGIFGRMFGHKFVKIVAGEWAYQSDYCWRCGWKRGGPDGQPAKEDCA